MASITSRTNSGVLLHDFRYNVSPQFIHLISDVFKIPASTWGDLVGRVVAMPDLSATPLKNAKEIIHLGIMEDQYSKEHRAKINGNLPAFITSCSSADYFFKDLLDPVYYPQDEEDYLDLYWLCNQLIEAYYRCGEISFEW